MAIYTRKGDKGKTALFSGKKVWKSDLRIEVLGTIDELNSVIGVVLSIKHQILSIKQELLKIQNDLFEIGSGISNPKYSILNTEYYSGRIKNFENMIDSLGIKTPKINSFILPGGGGIGAMLHLARAVCRRLERRVVELNNKRKINNEIIIYLNRLSDLLFTMARFANFKEEKKERIWVKKNG